jgi:hypothetical protein
MTRNSVLFSWRSSNGKFYETCVAFVGRWFATAAARAQLDIQVVR